jgi:hypothetical protein
MTEFITNALIFYVLVFLFLGYMLAITARKLGGFSQALAYFRDTENGSIFGIVLGGVIAPVVLAAIFTLIYSVLNPANAQPRYLEKTVVFAGLEATQKVSPQCYDGGVNDRLTSNLGVQQYLVGYKAIDLVANYTHHSCAINRDRLGYDALGLQVRWEFKR